MSLKDFPYYGVVYKVIKRQRGKSGADSWAKGEWGSHWYESLYTMLEECKTDAQAEAAVSSLFYLGEHHEHVQNSIFNHYRGIHDPIFDDGDIIYVATKQHKERKKGFLSRLFGK